MRDVAMTTSPRHAGASSRAQVAEQSSSGAHMVLTADNFETEADSIKEDEARRRALQNYMPIVGPVGWTNIGYVFTQAKAFVAGRRLPRLDRRRALALMRRLDSDAHNKPTTLASAVAMRIIRVELIGALIDALADLPDEKLCTVTAVKPAWVFTPDKLAIVSAHQIKHAFKEDLRRAGADTTDGPFVGFLHGEYEPTSGVFVLHFHCVTTRKKAALVVRRLRKLKRTYRPGGVVKRPIRISKMDNRVGQLTYLLKRFWPSRPIITIDGKERRCRRPMRVPEPYSSVYLLWLDQQSLIELTVMNDTWSKRKGGSGGWKAFCLIVAKWSRTMRSGGRSMSKFGQSTVSGAVSMGGG